MIEGKPFSTKGSLERKAVFLPDFPGYKIWQGGERMLTMIKKLWKEESGQGMTEYGLILALIVIAVIAIMATMGGNLKNKFENVSNALK